ncbi:hypothetical protein QYE76_019790 [Lolium multiflorum]|uniref:F-box domain-containing protein n=1 Tax=Lolium multiflorum TaxID=4521 RepID=A0AAD8R3N0_LOLMU|nr:hypothetical protein QYE76_019790 [Lolium multiflorum]
MAPSPSHRSPKRRRSLVSSHEATGSCTPVPAEGSTAAAATLPDDLIFDILSRVPVRSACRFRCVSRGWCALISDPAFVDVHKSLHAEPAIVVSSVHAHPDGSHDLCLMDMGGNVIRVIKTSRAFELLSTSQHDLICTRGYSFFADVASVIDPATGKVLEDIYDESVTRHIDIVFGFGRTVPSSVYKMVRLWSRRTWECHILTLGDDTGWRPSEMPPVPVATSPVAVNGVMYFLVFENQHNDTLLPFDLNIEKWEKMIEGPGKVVGPKLWKKRSRNWFSKFVGRRCLSVAVPLSVAVYFSVLDRSRFCSGPSAPARLPAPRTARPARSPPLGSVPISHAPGSALRLRQDPAFRVDAPHPAWFAADACADSRVDAPRPIEDARADSISCSGPILLRPVCPRSISCSA